MPGDPALMELREAYLEGKLVLFAGAGISAAAGLPSRGQLVEALLESARARKVAQDRLDEVAALAKQEKLAEALAAAKEALGEAEFGAVVERCLDDRNVATDGRELAADGREAPIPPIARAIASLAPHLRAVLTTNIDHLLERAFSGRWPALARATSNIGQRPRFILKLHGTLCDRSTWVLTEDDRDRAMYADPHLATAFTSVFHTGTLLFVGCDDPKDGFEPIFDRVRALAEGQAPRHFALVAAGKVKPHRRRLLEEAGVRVIEYDDAAGDGEDAIRMLRELAGAAEDPATEPQPPPPSGESFCPFPGLEFFDESRTRYFFGRTDEVNEALQRLGDTGEGHRRWLQIEGPSGTGKSSLVRAGLVPAVRHGFIHGGPAAWRVEVMRPGRDPAMSLAQAIHTALRAELAAASVSLQAIVDGFSSSEKALAVLLREHVPEGHGFLLVVDQLEEAFTMAEADARGRLDFDKVLAAALHDKGGPLYLVTAIRSDFTARLGDLPGLALRLNAEASRYYLKPMSTPGLRAAMGAPATLVGLGWEKGLTERIVGEARLAEGGLPLVAHVLQVLWSKRTGMTLTHAAYDEVGGAGGALSKSADTIMQGLGEQGRERARKMLLRLVKIGRGAEDTRQAATRAEAIEAAGGTEEAERVLMRLSGGRDPDKPDAMAQAPPRLLVVSRPEEGVRDDRVDLVHEALLQWPVLRGWIEASRKALERRDDLEAAAEVWQAAGAPADGLPRGAQLAYFRSAEGYGEKARKFLQAAEKRERRRVRVLRGIIAALVLGLAGVGGLAKWALDQQKEADKQRNDAEQQRALAESRLHDAIKVADQVVFSIDRKLEPIPGASDVRKELLQEAAQLQDSLLKGAGDSTEALRSRMAAHGRRGDLAVTHDDLPSARKEYEAALKIAQRLLEIEPSNTTFQRDLSVSYNNLGDVAMAAGDLAAARGFFDKGLELRKALANADPQNASLRRDLSVSYNSLGDVAMAAGDLAAARGFFDKGLELFKALADADPQNASLRRDLSVNYNKLGDVAKEAGDLAAARGFFDKGLQLIKALADADPQNASLRRDLSVSYNKLGDVAKEAGDLPAARGFFDKGLEIIKALADADPQNASLRRDLSVSYNKLGDVAKEAGDLPAARGFFDKGLEIIKALADADPQNASLRRDLSVSYNKLGDVAQAAGDLPAARGFFDKGLELRKALADADPQNASLRRDLSVSYERLGVVTQAAGDLPAARGYFDKRLEITKALADADPQNAQWQIDLSVSHGMLAGVAHAMKDTAAFRTHRDAAIAILDRLEHNGRGKGNDFVKKLRAALAEAKDW